MQIKTFYDQRTNTLTYIVYDQTTGDSLIIDPVLDYDLQASRIWTESLDQLLQFIEERQLKVHFILETHAHADHLSGAAVLKKRYPEAQLAAGDKIVEVQKLFKKILALPASFATDGSQFDRLLRDEEVITAGSLRVKVLHTPGHTPACVAYLIDEHVFTGDCLFMPDYGTGRCDFPGGSAQTLYYSVQKRLYTLPDYTRVYTGHDYQPGGRPLRFESTIAEEKQHNIHLKSSTSEAEYVAFRNGRDATLAVPKLLYQSIQVNLDGGQLPPPEENGVSYLKIPIHQ